MSKSINTQLIIVIAESIKFLPGCIIINVAILLDKDRFESLNLTPRLAGGYTSNRCFQDSTLY